MTVYGDTSFLVSFLNEDDVNHAAARGQVDMTESVAMARSLGETHGWKERHATFDLWHLAAAWSLSAGAFLTFDRRQAKIARVMGMKSGS